MNSLLYKEENSILSISTYIQTPLLLLQSVLYLFFGEKPVVHGLILGIAVLFMARCIPIWLRSRVSTVALSYGLILSVYLIEYVLFPENREYFQEYTFTLFFMCLPCFINLLILGENEWQVLILRRISAITLVLGGVYFLIVSVNGSKDFTYNMSFSYYMLLPALVFTYIFFQEHSWIHLLLALFAVASSFLIGSRGAIFAWLFFMFSAFIISRIKVGYKLVLTIIGAAIVFKYQQIISIVSNLLQSFGFQSRSLLLLEKGQLLNHDSGRIQIWEHAMQFIEEHPFVGNGIGADYRLLGEYTHNIALDLMMHFGIVVGAFLILLLLILLVYSLIKCKDKLFVAMLISYGAIPMLVSGTYLKSAAFWILLGFCISQLPIRLRLTRSNK